IVPLPVRPDGAPRVMQVDLVAVRQKTVGLGGKDFQRGETSLDLALQNIEVALKVAAARQQGHAHTSMTLYGFDHLVELLDQGQGIAPLAVSCTKIFEICESY